MAILAELVPNRGYRFLYPVGQVGFTAVTFLTVLPFTHEIVDFFAAGFGAATGAGSALTGAGSAFWLSFTLKVGAENVKPFAERVSQPSRSPTTVVATCAVPSDEMIETDADIGALENL